jgi:hypothetical protein
MGDGCCGDLRPNIVRPLLIRRGDPNAQVLPRSNTEERVCRTHDESCALARKYPIDPIIPTR